MKKEIYNLLLKMKIRILILSSLFFVLTICCSCHSEQQRTSTVPSDAAYKNVDIPVEKRIDALLSCMTVQEKIGQMTQIAKDRLQPSDVQTYFLGSVLSGGGGTPANNAPDGWADMVDNFQKATLSTRLGIPIIYGVDAVHGHNNMHNATIFPHNIGLGATRDADLVERIGQASAIETAAAGVLWTFAPCIAVARDPRWGRTYESFSQDPNVVATLGSAFIRGYQSADTGSVAKTATTAKHFLGDGGTVWGSSHTDTYMIDQGDARGDEAYLRTVLLPPYQKAIEAGARTVMVSFSSWNGIKMHAQKKLITDLLKGELGFRGFVVSDWGGMDQISTDYYTAIVTGINAGIDMNMVPYDANRFITTMTKAIELKDISMSRIDDAVRRILRVKFEMGLFEHPMANRSIAASVRSPEHLALAREAVAKSQVVLKNDGILPLKKEGTTLYVCGTAANNIGMQCGGWTLTWQGKLGNITAGTTILGGLQEKIDKDSVIYDINGNFNILSKDSICIVAVGEVPYAEGVGDNATLSLLSRDSATLKRAFDTFDSVILLIVSGRPLILGTAAEDASAVVASWLPGSEGGGVADILFGDAKPTGKLPFAWPVSADQLPLDNFISGEKKPLWPFGFGLTY